MIIVFLNCLAFLNVNGQNITENAQCKCWQPDVVITAADFKGDTMNPTARKYRDSIDLQAGSGVGTSRYLDIPKKKRNRGKMLEKAHFIPIWWKDQSYAFSTDSLTIAKQKVYFDMAELMCRMARRDLDSIRIKNPNTYFMTYFMYPKIANYYCQFHHDMHYVYTQEVFVQKKENAFENWRDTIRKRLEELKPYATTPADCQRQITNKPPKDYMLSPTLAEELKECE